MRRRDYILMMGLVTVSGLIGGSLTSWLVSGTAVAQDQAQPEKIVRTQSLQIVDAFGQVRIELSAKSPKSLVPDQVVIYDQNGKKMDIPADTIVKFGGKQFDPKPRIQITNNEGAIIWSAPSESDFMFVR
jgi:hypothetical protein